MFLRSKSVLFGRQVLHKSFMSSYNVRLLHGRHSIGHNYLIYAPKIYFFTHYSKKCLYFSIIIKASPHKLLNLNKILTKN